MRQVAVTLRSMRIADAIDQMRADGSYQAIVKRYR